LYSITENYINQILKVVVSILDIILIYTLLYQN